MQTLSHYTLPSHLFLHMESNLGVKSLTPWPRQRVKLLSAALSAMEFQMENAMFFTEVNEIIISWSNVKGKVTTLTEKMGSVDRGKLEERGWGV